MTKNVLGSLNQQDVENLTTLIEKLEQSPFNFLKLENDDFKIVIGKNGESETVEASNNSNAQVAAINPSRQEAQYEEVAATLEQPKVEAQSVPELVTEEGVVTIKAETAGLFYAQSEPGAPPYVKVGDSVDENTTVGLIEIMKVYSAITAGVKGEITRIHVQDTQLVEYGQPLFSVKVN